jgi:hypothetical protein
MMGILRASASDQWYVHGQSIMQLLVGESVMH